jgi:ABC-type branched-subunit amino acid transport system substrate-binding protein
LFLLIYLFIFRGYKSQDIILGASLPLSGINQDLGNEIIEGANSYFSHINARGGIDGKHIKFVYYDDKYEPQNTLTNINKLIYKDNAFALFGFVGTPTAKKVLPILQDTGIPFIAPYTGASFLRNLNISNIVNFRSSYQEEIEKIVDFLYNEKKKTKFAIFYQNDDYGEEGYIALVNSLQKRSLELVAEGTYKRNTLAISHALNEIRYSKPEVIIIIGAYKPSARFIEKARNCCAENVIFAPISFVNSDALVRELNYNGNNILFSQTVPSFNDDTLKVADEYLNLLAFYYPFATPTHVSFESFLAAKSVVMALKNVKGFLNTRGFLDELKLLDKNALGEIPIEYKNSQLLNKVFLLKYKDNKFYTINNEKN